MGFTHKVTAPLVIVKKAGDADRYAYADALLDEADLDPEWLRQQLDMGFVVPFSVNDEGVEEPVGPPKSSAGVDTWRRHAVSQGMDPDEADAMSKADLVKLYTED